MCEFLMGEKKQENEKTWKAAVEKFDFANLIAEEHGWEKTQPRKKEEDGKK
jgi:hypothetical protein